MDETAINPADQHSVTLPSGAIGTGVGGDVETIAESIEQRQETRTGQPAEAVVETVNPEKQPTRGQRRYSELTKERDEALKRAEDAERRAKESEERARLTTPREEPKPKAAEDPKPAAPVYTRPMPSENEIGTKYPSLGDYVRDLSAWTIEQQTEKLQKEFDARLEARIEADRASRQTSQAVSAAFDRGRAKYSDFDAVLNETRDTIWSGEQQSVFFQIPDFEHVMYALAKDQSELKRVHAITDPVKLAIALSQFIARPEAVALPASTPGAVRQSNAPTPPQPGGSGSRTAQKSLAELADSGDYAAYKARRDADRGVKRTA